MSIAMDDLPTCPLDKRTSSRVAPSERQLTKLGTKSKTLRLDSPTTLEACKELGILVDDLKQKTLEEFKDPLLEEGVIELRFNHYLKRYNQFVKDVMSKKRQIVRAQQRNQRLQLQLQDQFSPNNNLTSVKSAEHLPVVSHALMNNTMKHNMSSANTSFQSPVWANYNKTMMYLRGSHATAEVKNISDILGNEGSRNMLDETLEQFDTALGNEVLKFNRIKRQKQKEARDAFDEEMRRLKIIEEAKEKEKRRMDREKKQGQEKKKTEEEKKKTLEEKLEKIREADRKYNTKKAEEKEKIRQKLEDAKTKFASETEEKKRLIAEKEAKLEEKRKIAEERRKQLREEEQERCDQLNIQIHQKLYQSEELHNTTLTEKMSRVQVEANKIEDRLQKIRTKQQQEIEESVQKVAEKLAHKEESLQVFYQQQRQAMKKKEKEIVAKNRKLMEQQSNINEKYNDRMKEINERFQRVQDNLEAKREHDEKNQKMKQELTRLKISDKQENCKRKERQTEYERQKIFDRQKHDEEKLIWLKHQKEILKHAKVEVSLQSKIEKERIEEAVQQLSKLTYESGTSAILTEQQKRILKEILRPEDYKYLQEEERRKEEERQEAEEKRKAAVKV